MFKRITCGLLAALATIATGGTAHADQLPPCPAGAVTVTERVDWTLDTFTCDPTGDNTVTVYMRKTGDWRGRCMERGGTPDTYRSPRTGRIVRICTTIDF